jgi:hypothetical protein
VAWKIDFEEDIDSALSYKFLPFQESEPTAEGTYLACVVDETLYITLGELLRWRVCSGCGQLGSVRQIQRPRIGVCDMPFVVSAGRSGHDQRLRRTHQ